MPFLLRILGTPTEAEWPGIKDLADYKPTFPRFRPQRLGDLIKQAYARSDVNHEPDIAAVDLLIRLLCYDPIKRITAKSALTHVIFITLTSLTHHLQSHTLTTFAITSSTETEREREYEYYSRMEQALPLS